MSNEGGEASGVSSFEAGAPSGTFTNPTEAKTDVSSFAPAPEAENEQNPSTEEQVVNLQTPEEAELSKMSPRERAGGALRGGVEEIIRKAYDDGFFSEPGKEEAKKDAEAILKAADEGDLDSDGLKLYFKTLKAIGGETADQVGEIAAEHLRVKAGTDLLTKEEWQEKLEQATPEERTRLESEGLYGFVFPEEPAREKSAEDEVFGRELQKLEERRNKLKPGESLSQEDGETLMSLRFALQATGDAGVVLKGMTLERLRELVKLRGSMVLGLEEAVKSIESKMPQAESNFLGAFHESGATKEEAAMYLNALKKGKLPEMLQNKTLPPEKLKGLSELIFGKELSKKDIGELLEVSKKKGLKDWLLLTFFLAAIGPMEFGKEVAPIPSSKN